MKKGAIAAVGSIALAVGLSDVPGFTEAQKEEARRRNAIHRNECPHCGRKFQTPSGLFHHLRNYHDDNSVTLVGG